MADQNVIEVVIKSLVKGADQPGALAKSLDLLAKQGALTGAQLNQLSSAIDTVNKKFGTQGVTEFTKGIGEGMRKGADEFIKAGSGVVKASEQIATAQTGASRATDILGAGTESLHVKTLGLSRVLALAATGLGDMGPAGQIASNA